MIKKTVFPNGLRFLAIPEKDAQTVSVLVLVGTGSKYEDRQTSGISHFLEHMLFKGTKKLPTPTDVAEVLDRVGGSYNAFTGEDYTGYYAKVDHAHFDLALGWVADIFLHSLLPDGELQKERGVITEEINMYRDNPMLHVQSLWGKLLYGDQPAGWDIAGTKETVGTISREQIARYREDQYTAPNTVVVIAGNIIVEECAQKVWKLFEHMRISQSRAKHLVVETQIEPAVLVEFRETDQSHLILGARGYTLKDSERYAQAVLAGALGGMMSSRLFTRVREELGLAYHISSSSETTPETGYLATSAGVKNSAAEEAVKEILKAYRSCADTTISPKELEKAKNNLWGKLVIGLETSDAKAFFYGLQELLEGRIFRIEETYATIQKVRASDLKRVAEAIFRPEKLNLTILGPFRDSQKFESLLRP